MEKAQQNENSARQTPRRRSTGPPAAAAAGVANISFGTRRCCGSGGRCGMVGLPSALAVLLRDIVTVMRSAPAASGGVVRR